MTQTKTTCPYCGVGCGVLITQDVQGQFSVSGDPQHPANYGRLCSKGAALAETLSLDGRLLQPQVAGKPVSWDTALQTVAQSFQDIIAEHGPDAVAFYVSGQLLTEDYYVANKLMKGFIGSANIDTNSRLCMSSAVAAHKRAFGSDTVPGCYEDLERAKLIVLTGSNTAWCHPVVFQRIKKAKQDNPDLQVVVIDPRATATCDIADLHLAVKPGSDHILFAGLLCYLQAQGERHELFVSQHTEGVEAALTEAQRYAGSLAEVAAHCQLDAELLEKFYRLFARTERVVTVFSQGINQWSYGTDRANAIINCHLLTGRIGRPGMGPFSITGQPNAMGGREVGGLANQLTAHLALENPAHRALVQKFWQSPVIADREGLKAVDMFRAIEQGQIKAVWIMATNPAVSLPDTQQVRRALLNCPLVVVSDCIQETDTTRFAHVLLPAQTWGERDGTVTNSERRISRQRPFISAPSEARADWWIISEVAKRMGHAQHFSYTQSAEIFSEYAQLSGIENNGSRDFDISGLQQLSTDDYAQLTPIQWPVTAENRNGTARMFADGQFFTDSRRARFIVVSDIQPAANCDTTYPLVLNTGRVRDQWHTMTRTGKSVRLSGHIYEPYVEIHPDDAQRYRIRENDLVQVNSLQATLVVRARISPAQQVGSVFVPIHWNDQYASLGVVDSLVSATVDPVSGQPEYKHTPVSVSAYQPQWYGFLLSRRRLNLLNASYWSLSRGNGIWRYELAGDDKPEHWPTTARSLLCQQAEQVEWIEYHDKALNRYRAARLENGRLESCLFISPDVKLPEREWLANLFDDDQLVDADRRSILTGKPADLQHDHGRTVCACFGVGINDLTQAIQSQQLTTVEQIGNVLKAGTNCGSCVPELRALLASLNP